MKINRILIAYSISFLIIYSNCSGPFGSSTADPEFHPTIPARSASLAISETDTYDFGNKTIYSVAEKEFLISNSGTSAVSNISPASFSGAFAYKGGTYPGTGGTCGSELGAESSCTVLVTYTPNSAETTTGTLSLSYTAGGASAASNRLLKGTGLSLANLSISDGSTYNFGLVRIGSTSDKSFTITNSGQTPASSVLSGIDSFFSFPSAFPGGGTCGNTIAANSSCTASLRFSPTNQGTATSTFSLAYNDGYTTSNSTRPVRGLGAGPSGTIDSTFGTGGEANYDSGGIEVANAAILMGNGYMAVFGSEATQDFQIAVFKDTGALDTSFNTIGAVTANINGNDTGRGGTVQTDGRLIIVGDDATAFDNWVVIRYNTNGIIDTSFATTGTVTLAFGTRAFAEDVVIQTDGKIVVGGYEDTDDMAVARFNTDGSVDTSFHSDGKLTLNFVGNDLLNKVLIQTNGTILGFGQNGGDDFALVRFLNDGSLDTSFFTDGTLTNPVGAAQDGATFGIEAADGKLYAIGTANNGVDRDLAIARYDNTGLLDTSFMTDGTTFFSITNAVHEAAHFMTIDTNGKIFIAGEDNADFAFARLNSDGTFDTSFHTTGKGTEDFTGGTDIPYGGGIQTDGRICLGGKAGANFGAMCFWP